MANCEGGVPRGEGKPSRIRYENQMFILACEGKREDKG